jgi:hypothetical protein
MKSAKIISGIFALRRAQIRRVKVPDLMNRRASLCNVNVLATRHLWNFVVVVIRLLQPASSTAHVEETMKAQRGSTSIALLFL